MVTGEEVILDQNLDTIQRIFTQNNNEPSSNTLK